MVQKSRRRPNAKRDTYVYYDRRENDIEETRRADFSAGRGRDGHEGLFQKEVGRFLDEQPYRE
jgi:hypothetical protein